MSIQLNYQVISTEQTVATEHISIYFIISI